jgi:signal transduction histidine kinase
MSWEKLSTTLMWSLVPIAGAMVADYTITILLLHAYQEYTPFVTLSVALVVSLPVVYIMVSGRIDLRNARDLLVRARDEAIRANETKDQFFANVSHELRTPLNAILGFSELLSLDSFAGKRVEYAHLIHNSGAHLLGLVNDLLDLARIESGKFELHDESVDIGDLLRECGKTMEARSTAAKLAVGFSIEQNLPLVYGDRRALKQITLNLITNAIKFTPPGGSIDVFARLGPAGDLFMGVKDDGIGIDKDDLTRVFERFGQGRHDVASAQEGTGLGLPIVKGLAEAHGGRAMMESQPGIGTCVTIWLPRRRMMPRAKVAVAS